MKLSSEDCNRLGRCLQGFFFGLYSGIFAIYLQHHAKRTEKERNILFYALCVLYASCGVCIILNIAVDVVNTSIMYYLKIIEATAFGCADFIAQSILIYRCWIVWRHNLRVVIIPSILAFTSLVIWIPAAVGVPLATVRGQVLTDAWGDTLAVIGLAVSMIVNALVIGLIVFRIFNVFQEVKTSTVDDQILGVTSGSTLRRIMFVMIESGMALFSIQLARLVLGGLVLGHATDDIISAYYLILPLHEMLNGITPTIILVRVSMGLSFHDEDSLAQASIGSLHFASDVPMSETGSSIQGIVDQEKRDAIRLGSDLDI